MAWVIVGLLGVFVVAAGIVVYHVRPSTRRKGKSSEARADELRRLREAESEVERTCRETQEAIITRAMWRIVRPMGGGGSSE